MSARRPILDQPRCAEPGCTERALFEYDTQTERREAMRRRVERPWRCMRHARPEAVLSATNAVRQTVATATRLLDLPHLFWVGEGESTGSGFAFGPGFKAFADDFPEGTRLEVTARILPPESEEQS